MKPFVAHAVLVAFIVCSNGSQAFESHLSSSEEIKPWWQPLKSTLEPFENKPTILNHWWKHLKTRTKPSESKYTTLNPWWKHLKTTTKPFENKPTSLNPWWRFLRKTEKTFRKRDETTYPWWRHLRTTQKPFRKRDQTTYSWWKLFRRTEKPFLILRQDYRDSYGHNRESNQHTGHLPSVEEIEPWWKPLRVSKIQRNNSSNPWWKLLRASKIQRNNSSDPWWRPLQRTQEPYGERDHTIYAWFKPNKKETAKALERESNTSNLPWTFWKRTTKPWWTPLEKTTEPYWKTDDRWKYITTGMPYWKSDHTPFYSDSNARWELNGKVVIAIVLFVIAVIVALIICKFRYCDHPDGCLQSFCQDCEDEYTTVRRSDIRRLEARLEAATRNSRPPQAISVSYSAPRQELFSSGTNENMPSSSNTDYTSDQPPDYTTVVKNDLVDGHKRVPNSKIYRT